MIRQKKCRGQPRERHCFDVLLFAVSSHLKCLQQVDATGGCDYIRKTSELSKEEDADVNLPKIDISDFDK